MFNILVSSIPKDFFGGILGGILGATLGGILGIFLWDFLRWLYILQFDHRRRGRAPERVKGHAELL